jgi:hypothetical protein
MKLTAKKSYLKTSHINTNTVVSADGEVLSQEVNNIKYLANTQEEFFIIYASAIGIIEKGMSQAETSLYAHILKNYSVGADIGISKQMRINLGTKLSLNERTVLNTLGMLVTKKLLYTTSKGVYKINPRYAYKGSTFNRNRDLKFVMEVECPHC